MLINSSFGSPRLLSPVTTPIVAQETAEDDKTQDTTKPNSTTQESTQSSAQTSAVQETQDRNTAAESGANTQDAETDGARSEPSPRESLVPVRAGGESVVLSQAAVSEGLAPSDPSIAEARARRMAEATVERLRMEDLVRSLTEVRQASIGATGPAEAEADGQTGGLKTAQPAELGEAQRTNRLV